MQRQTKFEKNMRQKPPSPSPRFSRTCDLLLSRYPDSADLSINSSSSSSIMISNDRSNSKVGQWRASISAPLCAFCNKTVYPAEEIMAAGQRFHKLCLKCTACNTLLNPGNFSEREKKIYCVPCYRRRFAPRAVGYGLATSYLETPPTSPNTNQEDIDFNNRLSYNDNDSNFEQKTSINSSDDDFRPSKSLAFANVVTKRQIIPTDNRSIPTYGRAFKMMSISGNICPRCSKTVYSAEEIKAIGKSFHKQCYRCAHCKGSISGGRYSEHHGEIYDNNCYQRLFGPRGVGFGMGAGALSTGI